MGVAVRFGRSQGPAPSGDGAQGLRRQAGQRARLAPGVLMGALTCALAAKPARVATVPGEAAGSGHEIARHRPVEPGVEPGQRRGAGPAGRLLR